MVSIARPTRMTTLRVEDPDLNRVQDLLKQSLFPVLQNPVLSAADFRWNEIQPTANSGTPTFALQYRSSGTTWTTILTVDSTGQIAQSAWIAPTLTNGWVNVGGTIQTAAYFKDSVGFVHLRGAVSTGTLALAIFTLPSGYRPSKDAYFSIQSNAAFGRLLVSLAGAVICDVGNNAGVSLDGVTFDTRT